MKGKVVLFASLFVMLAVMTAGIFLIKNHNEKITVHKMISNQQQKEDIEGSVQLIFTPDFSDMKITEDDLYATKKIMESRLICQNITEFDISVERSTNTIILRLPESYEYQEDFDELVEKLCQPARLSFCRGEDINNVIMDGSAIESATATVDEATGMYVLHMTFTDEGKEVFAAATAEMIGQQIAVYLDDTMICSPTVQEAITGGQAQISLGSATAEETRELADIINAGALPYSLFLVQFGKS